MNNQPLKIDDTSRADKLKKKKLSRKTRKIRNKVKENVDHLIAKHREWSEYWANKKLWNVVKHSGKHDFFWTMLPHEQLIEVLRYNYNVLDKETRDDMIAEMIYTIEFYLKSWKFYNEKCFKRGKMPLE